MYVWGCSYDIYMSMQCVCMCVSVSGIMFTCICICIYVHIIYIWCRYIMLKQASDVKYTISPKDSFSMWVWGENTSLSACVCVCVCICTLLFWGNGITFFLSEKCNFRNKKSFLPYWLQSKSLCITSQTTGFKGNTNSCILEPFST